MYRGLTPTVTALLPNWAVRTFLLLICTAIFLLTSCVVRKYFTFLVSSYNLLDLWTNSMKFYMKFKRKFVHLVLGVIALLDSLVYIWLTLDEGQLLFLDPAQLDTSHNIWRKTKAYPVSLASVHQWGCEILTCMSHYLIEI